MRIRIITHNKKNIQKLPLPIVERIRKRMTLRRPRLYGKITILTGSKIILIFASHYMENRITFRPIFLQQLKWNKQKKQNGIKKNG